MFNRETFIVDCLTAIGQADSHKAVHEIVARAVTNPASIIGDLGDPGWAHVVWGHPGRSFRYGAAGRGWEGV